MKNLITALKNIALNNSFDKFEWNIPINCPVHIPKDKNSYYEKNVYLKENFYSVVRLDRTFKSHYWIIQDWGKIRSFRKTERNDQRIKRFLNELGKGELTRSSFDCFSSLSKVGSFINSDEYVIYDSRAIYSLNWLLFKYSSKISLFPQPNGRNSELAKFDLQTIFRFSKEQYEFKSYKFAFHEYCTLLKYLSKQVFGKDTKPYVLEMLLFMIAPTWIITDIENSVSIEIKRSPNISINVDAGH